MFLKIAQFSKSEPFLFKKISEQFLKFEKNSNDFKSEQKRPMNETYF